MQTPPPLPSLEAILENNPGWLEEAIDTRAASKLTGVPVQTLETWRSRGGGPKFLKLGSKTVRYPRRELLSWMQAKVCSSTADAETRPVVTDAASEAATPAEQAPLPDLEPRRGTEERRRRGASQWRTASSRRRLTTDHRTPARHGAVVGKR